jgi:hypothetical protein
MSSSSSRRPAFEVNTSLLRGGAVLFGIGACVALAGATLSALTLVDATRRWIQELDESPREMAHRRWEQGRSALAAGAGVWREQGNRPARAEARESARPDGVAGSRS